MEENIILKSVKVDKNRVDYDFVVSEPIAKYFTTNKMSLIYDCDMSSVPLSVLAIPFVANFIPMAWITNASLWVEELDKTFYNSVKALKVAYQEMYYHFPFKGRLVSAKIIYNQRSLSDSSLLLFTGGLDAQTSFLRNKDNIKTLCNIQGWYTDYNVKNEAADIEQKFAKDFALSQGIDCVLVKSNFATIIDTKAFASLAKVLGNSWWHGFNHSMAFISISIPLAYVNDCRQIIISSSGSTGKNYLIASFATTDSEFNFLLNGHTIHDGFELNRQSKTRYLVDYQKAQGENISLRVCSFNKVNCCRCEKCFRTMVALVSEGANVSDFGFDIDKPLKEHFEQVLREELALWGIKKEIKLYLEHTKEIMKQNLDIVEDKEFAQWFLDFDFIAEKKKALRRYYATNFWSIVRRKIKERF